MPTSKKSYSLDYNNQEIMSWDQRASLKPPNYRHGLQSILSGLNIGDDTFDALPGKQLLCHGQRSADLPQNEEPDWVDWERVRRGQKLWLYHLSRAYLSLSLALISGFCIARFAKVLYESGYAVDGETARKRYNATSYAIMDFFRFDLQDPKSRARTSLYSVRAMHSFARLKSRNLFNRDEGEGVPLSQLDMAEVQLGFSAVCIRFMERDVGYGPIFREDIQDMVYTWRLIGWHLGILDEYNVCKSLSFLDAAMEDYMAWMGRRLQTIRPETHELRRTAIEGFAVQSGMGKQLWYGALNTIVYKNPNLTQNEPAFIEKKTYAGIDVIAKLVFRLFRYNFANALMRNLLIRQREAHYANNNTHRWKLSATRRLSALHDRVTWRFISLLYLSRHILVVIFITRIAKTFFKPKLA